MLPCRSNSLVSCMYHLKKNGFNNLNVQLIMLKTFLGFLSKVQTGEKQLGVNKIIIIIVVVEIVVGPRSSLTT